MLTIRKATSSDAEALKDLYLYHLTTKAVNENQDMAVWEKMLTEFEQDKYYNILVGEADGKVVASVSLIVIRNLTHDINPYAIIENVVTHADFRGRHYANRLMDYASELAKDFGCYKIMLLTGSKLDSTLGFYEGCGFNRNDKTAFIKWL